MGFNPYNPCVANRLVKGKQYAVTWHVDNCTLSHMDPKVNNKFLAELETKHHNDKIGKTKATRNKSNNHLTMTLNITTLGVGNNTN